MDLLTSVSALLAPEWGRFCPNCLGTHIEREDYLNACRNAGCRLNGPVTYHLNCGSQHRDICADCGYVLYDSADEPIEMKEVHYCCSQCEAEGIQPGHFACGNTYSVPVSYGCHGAVKVKVPA